MYQNPYLMEIMVKERMEQVAQDVERCRSKRPPRARSAGQAKLLTLMLMLILATVSAFLLVG